jgi:hypothetical protein
MVSEDTNVDRNGPAAVVQNNNLKNSKIFKNDTKL